MGTILLLVDLYFYLSLLKEINDLILFDFQIMIKIFTETHEPLIKDHFMGLVVTLYKLKHVLFCIIVL